VIERQIDHEKSLVGTFAAGSSIGGFGVQYDAHRQGGTAAAIPLAQRTPATARLARNALARQISPPEIQSRNAIMAVSEVQQRDIFVKVVGVLMVLLLLYGALSLAGVVK
jgi:hypothetical protein